MSFLTAAKANIVPRLKRARKRRVRKKKARKKKARKKKARKKENDIKVLEIYKGMLTFLLVFR